MKKNDQKKLTDANSKIEKNVFGWRMGGALSKLCIMERQSHVEKLINDWLQYLSKLDNNGNPCHFFL